jgi:hypothetical protein
VCVLCVRCLAALHIWSIRSGFCVGCREERSDDIERAEM